MPTVRPRHTLTETPDLARALDAADEFWPELHGDRGALVRRLVEVGTESVEKRKNEVVVSRRAALHTAAGAATGAYPPNAAETLKNEWPE